MTRRNDRPAERLAQQRWLDGLQWALAGEAVDGRLAGLGVLTRVAHLLGPGQEAIVQLAEAGDAVRLGLGQEPFADEAIEPLLLAAALGRSTVGCGSAGCPAPRKLRSRAALRIGRAVIDVQPLGQTAALDGRAQHVLAGARVLVGHPAAVESKRE